MHPGAGKDAGHPRRDLVRYVAVWHADFRPVALGLVPGGAGGLRDGSRERLECRRVQAAHAGHRLDLRPVAAIHAVRRLRTVSLFVFMGRAAARPFFLRGGVRPANWRYVPRGTLYWLVCTYI